MQTPIRYTVVNQGGQTVIRAVPVPRRPVRPASKKQEAQPRKTASEPRRQQPAFFDRVRRLAFG